jgi:hypothetical protein
LKSNTVGAVDRCPRWVILATAYSEVNEKLTHVRSGRMQHSAAEGLAPGAASRLGSTNQRQQTVSVSIAVDASRGSSHPKFYHIFLLENRDIERGSITIAQEVVRAEPATPHSGTH